MRSLVAALLPLMLSGTAAAEMLATDATNPNFNRFLAAQKLPVCQPGTYFSFLSNSALDTYAAPPERTAAWLLDSHEKHVSEGRQVLRRVAEPGSLTLYVESVDGRREVYKTTYVDGYTLDQQCEVK